MIVNTWEVVGVAQARSGSSLPVMDLVSCCSQGLSSPLARSDAEQLAKALKAVADPARLQLIALIRSTGEACACDLNEPLGLSQPTVSHHLKTLTEAGILRREQRGQWAWFSVDEGALGSLGQLFA